MSQGLRALFDAIAVDCCRFDPAGLTFWHRDTARLAAIGFVALAALLLVLHLSLRRRPGRGHVVLPALLRTMPAARLAWVRHLPALLFAAGLPFALMALADPYSSLVAAETT